MNLSVEVLVRAAMLLDTLKLPSVTIDLNGR